MNLFDHNDNFEQFLREATENFKMRPSVRVWNSIYNNIHPSKKSPSAASFLIFIISFFILNNNNSVVFQQIKSTDHKAAIQIQEKQPLLFTAKLKKPIVYKKQIRNHVNIENKKIEQNIINANNLLSIPSTIENDNTIHFTEINNQPQLKDFSLHQQINLPIAATEKNENIYRQKPINITVKNNVENELSYQLYATSSVGYSNGYKYTELEFENTSTDHIQNSTDLSRSLKYMPEYNLEAGGAFLLNVTSSLRLKAGMQLNYTNYRLSNDDIYGEIANSESYSPLVNNTLETDDMQILSQEMNPELKKYNSSTYQISIPFGTEFELIGNHQLKWFAGATIQPSYLLGGYPGQTTNEMKSYFQDGYGFRKWNVNTSFETFLSYKLRNGSRINAGPQFRYQLFSSFDNNYLYNDKQYNIGLKLGISRNL